ncbi:GM19570 [Drosophila sechellia]|uniref:GM19570 n=1 Tax=Drosophila sechellia TaxID=7238 RepID=B4ILT7_DROSE|nr:GM19570 [Drosophila sechellia]
MEALVNYSSEDDQEDGFLKQKNNNNNGSGNSPRGKEREREREREKTKPMSQQQSRRSSSGGRIDEVKNCRCTKSIFTPHIYIDICIYQIPYAIVLLTSYVCVCVYRGWSGSGSSMCRFLPLPQRATPSPTALPAAAALTVAGRIIA